MSSYPYRHLLLNNREVAINDIVTDSVVAQSDFEVATIAFLKGWLNDKETFIQKTSGSTGAPKEITITRDQMIASARATEKALGLKRGHHALICVDTRFIAGKMMCVRSFVTGMQMNIIDPVANPLASIPANTLIDFVALVPYQVDEILSSPLREQLNHLGTAIVGGAPVKAATIEALQSFNTRFFLTYGMTETMSHIALQRLNGTDAASGFECLPGVVIATDERGCLVAEVPWISGKVVTNDLVEIKSSKIFQWLGRVDNVINTGGFKANPEKIEFQIEKIFTSLNIDRRFFVGGLPDDRTGERVALFIEGSEIVSLLQELQNRLKSNVQRFELPRSIHFVDQFSYTPSNKLDRATTMRRFK